MFEMLVVVNALDKSPVDVFINLLHTLVSRLITYFQFCPYIHHTDVHIDFSANTHMHKYGCRDAET